jgi:hypothetical protein
MDPRRVPASWNDLSGFTSSAQRTQGALGAALSWSDLAPTAFNWAFIGLRSVCSPFDGFGM